MRYRVQIKVLKNDDKKSLITDYSTIIEGSEPINGLDFKVLCKNSLNNLNREPVSDVLYFGSKEVKDTDTVSTKSGLEYNLVVKA